MTEQNGIVGGGVERAIGFMGQAHLGQPSAPFEGKSSGLEQARRGKQHLILRVSWRYRSMSPYYSPTNLGDPPHDRHPNL
jgi:hypothetical protein